MGAAARRLASLDVFAHASGRCAARALAEHSARFATAHLREARPMTATLPGRAPLGDQLLFQSLRLSPSRANYRVFRRRLHVPLLTVELSFDGNFALRDDDPTSCSDARRRRDVAEGAPAETSRSTRCPPTAIASRGSTATSCSRRWWPRAANLALDRHR
jgi:hypothetical protein